MNDAATPVNDAATPVNDAAPPVNDAAPPGSDRPRADGPVAVDERTYHGRPILKQSVWTWEIPAYFFVGGAAATASMIGLAADASGRASLARTARRVAAVAISPAPALLVHDLGRPSRFYNMLRVAKPSSPMSVGTWTLTAYAPAAIGAALLDHLGRARRLRVVAGAVAAGTGPMMATYTAVLVANTAVPVWQQARRELPAVFAASALAAGAAATTLASAGSMSDEHGAAPVRRLGAVAAIGELAADRWMMRRLGPLAAAYDAGTARRWHSAATWCSAVGALALAVGSRSRWSARLGALAVLAGSAGERFAVMAAGRRSVDDPSYVLVSQRSERSLAATSPPVTEAV